MEYREATKTYHFRTGRGYPATPPYRYFLTQSPQRSQRVYWPAALSPLVFAMVCAGARSRKAALPPHEKPQGGLKPSLDDPPQAFSVGFRVPRSGFSCRVAAMQRIAEARPVADVCLHTNPPAARRAWAQPRAATRFVVARQRPTLSVPRLPSRLCVICPIFTQNHFSVLLFFSSAVKL